MGRGIGVGVTRAISALASGSAQATFAQEDAMKRHHTSTQRSASVFDFAQAVIEEIERMTPAERAKLKNEWLASIRNTAAESTNLSVFPR